MKKSALFIAVLLLLTSCGLTQKLLCQGSMEPDEFNTAFSNYKCDSIVSKNASHWYMDRRLS